MTYPDVIRRLATPVDPPAHDDHPAAPAPAAPAATSSGQKLPTGAALDELVDTLVDRLERRVVDELQRRGVNRAPGVF